MSAPEAPKPAATSLPIAGALGGVLGTVGSVAGAGWSGVAALAFVGVALPFAYSFIVRMLNGKVDSRDLERAGENAGKTAQDIQNQGRQVSQGLDDAQAADPPTDGAGR